MNIARGCSSGNFTTATRRDDTTRSQQTTIFNHGTYPWHHYKPSKWFLIRLLPYFILRAGRNCSRGQVVGRLESVRCGVVKAERFPTVFEVDCVVNPVDFITPRRYNLKSARVDMLATTQQHRYRASATVLLKHAITVIFVRYARDPSSSLAC